MDIEKQTTIILAFYIILNLVVSAMLIKATNGALPLSFIIKQVLQLMPAVYLLLRRSRTPADISYKLTSLFLVFVCIYLYMTGYIEVIMGGVVQGGKKNITGEALMGLGVAQMLYVLFVIYVIYKRTF